MTTSFTPTKDQIKQEVLRCGREPAYFIKNYTRIVHPLQGLIPFNTYPFQDDLMQAFEANRFSIVLKARQLGISTLLAAYSAWLCLFHKDKEVFVVATKEETAANLVKKSKRMLYELPEWMRIATIAIDNQRSFQLSNYSQMKAGTSSPSAARSEALALLIIDEAAHIPGMDDIWTSIYPTISTGGKCIAVSTPLGTGNWFYEQYTDSVAGNNDWYHIKLPWHVHPHRDEHWFEAETKNMNERQIAQEYLCSFGASGDTFIAGADISYLLERTQPPKYRAGLDRNLWVWVDPVHNHGYLISVDVARGDAEDFSAFHILDLDNLTVVAEYQGKIEPDHLATFLNELGRNYNNAMIVVENNMLGFAVLTKLVDMDYPNLFFSKKSDGSYVAHNYAYGASNVIPGLAITQRNRLLVLHKMEEYIRNRTITILSERLAHELETFVWINGKPQAQRTKHDDLVMSLALGCWVRDTALFENLREIEYRKACLANIICTTTKFDTRMRGQLGYNKKFDVYGAIEDKQKENSYHNLTMPLGIFKR